MAKRTSTRVRAATARRQPDRETCPEHREEYRVFISYSRDDRELAEKLARHLESIGIKPLWDRRLVGGEGFTEQIKSFIAHAHVFVSIVTEISIERGWVHQELGYAHALNIPVLPILVNRDPSGMVSMIQGVQVRPDGSDLAETITLLLLEQIVARARCEHAPLYECAPDVISRARLLAAYSNRIAAMGEHGCVRQKGALTSFNILDKHAKHPFWEKRYSEHPPGRSHYEALRNERLALEKHVHRAGCRLIVNIASMHREDLSLESRLIRVATLTRFLEAGHANRHLSVVITNNPDPGESLTLVGDWFSAESVTRRGPLSTSYLQTIFTRHAPTVRENFEAFEEEFTELLQRMKVRPGEPSRREALRQLRHLAAHLECKLPKPEQRKRSRGGPKDRT